MPNSNLFVSGSIHQGHERFSDLVRQRSFMSFPAFLRAQSLPDVFLTIYSQKTILSFSAYYFHLVALMFKVTVTVSICYS